MILNFLRDLPVSRNWILKSAVNLNLICENLDKKELGINLIKKKAKNIGPCDLN